MPSVKGTVLVVDDERSVLGLAGEMLGTGGYQVIEAEWAPMPCRRLPGPTSK